jgi:hypothetical protein
MINQRYSSDEPCTACGRSTCEGCVSGYYLDSQGDGLELADVPTDLERIRANGARLRYDLASMAQARRAWGYRQ